MLSIVKAIMPWPASIFSHACLASVSFVDMYLVYIEPSRSMF